MPRVSDSGHCLFKMSFTMLGYVSGPYCYWSFNPLPWRILGMYFSTLEVRVVDCLACEKYRRYPLCRPGVKPWNAAFKSGSLSKARD